MMGHNPASSSVGTWRKYVTELALEHTQPMQCDEMSGGPRRPVVLNPRRLQSQASSSSSSMSATLTIGQPHWKDIPAVQEGRQLLLLYLEDSVKYFYVILINFEKLTR